MHKYIIALFLVSSLSLFAETKDAKNEDDLSVAKVSEMMGHLIGKNLQSLDLPLDLEALVKGLQDEAKGKALPLKDEEYELAIASLQEESHERASRKNLSQANEFLKTNEHSDGIISLEQGKLQYKILKQGSGETVRSYNTPLIRYQGRALNGEWLQADKEEERIVLDEALPGLKAAMVGMKEGEIRTIYIHPDLGYGKESYTPNSLLIFEVEILKADVSAEAPALLDPDSERLQAENPVP